MPCSAPERRQGQEEETSFVAASTSHVAEARGRAAASRHFVQGSPQELLAEDPRGRPADGGVGGRLPEVCASLRPDL